MLWNLCNNMRIHLWCPGFKKKYSKNVTNCLIAVPETLALLSPAPHSPAPVMVVTFLLLSFIQKKKIDTHTDRLVNAKSYL